jgi:DnaA family protein
VQLPLTFKAQSDQRFIDFLGQESLRILIERAAEGLDQENIFISGPQGSGKTHLLRACVSHRLALNQHAAYLPLDKMANFLAQALEGFEQHTLLCLDDVQCIAGNQEAEVALFHFFNRAKAAGTCMVFAANDAPSLLGIGLPDLVSRLEQSVRMSVAVLDEAGKRQVLLQRAQSRGLELDETVLDFLFTRVSRDLHTLSQLLERLDHASLAAQRRLTIPFIKIVLNSSAM